MRKIILLMIFLLIAPAWARVDIECEPTGEPNEVLIKYRITTDEPNKVRAFAMDITISDGVCEDAKIALGAVAPRPIRATKAEAAIKGKDIGKATAEAASAAAVTDAVPLNMNSYKVKITKTLVKRAILS